MMLIIEHKIDSAEDPENEKFIGSTVTKFPDVVPPTATARAAWGKMDLQALCEVTDVDLGFASDAHREG